MQVILREHIENLGSRGDVVKVAAGYARNYLLPRKLALAVTDENKRQIARERKNAEARGREQHDVRIRHRRGHFAGPPGEGLRGGQAQGPPGRAAEGAGRVHGAGEGAPRGDGAGEGEGRRTIGLLWPTSLLQPARCRTTSRRRNPSSGRS